MNRLLSLIVLLSLGLAPALSSGAEAERDGAQLYQDYGCILCHGISGHRGATGGPVRTRDHTFTSFNQLVRYPAGRMPAYPPDLLTEVRLRRIFTYLRGFDPAPEVEDIGALRRLREDLYEGAED